MSTAIVVMSRAPIPGKTKTRLMTHLSEEEAAELHKSFLRDISKLLSSLSNFNDIKLYLSYTPPVYRHLFDGLIGEDFNFIVQQGRDLGEKMYNSLQQVRADNEKQIIIGSDLPFLQPEIFIKAIEELERNDIVFGPTPDGGYYLLGVKESHPYLFERDCWGGSEVLKKTIAEIDDRARYKYSLIKECRDVDTFEDLQNLSKELQNPGNWSYYPHYTARYINFLQSKRGDFDGENWT
ncbi:MAG: TIGR04282 family arsenosugar biosynthesis glycosyltransferase [Halanaerobiales bacterium]